MSRLVATPRAVPSTTPPQARQATPRQPVRPGVPVYLQRVPADSPARARIAEQVQSQVQVQRADATTAQQAGGASAGPAGLAGPSAALAGGSGLDAGPATPATPTASASGATVAPTPPAARSGVGRPPPAGETSAGAQAPGVTADAQAPGVTADAQAPGVTADAQTPGVTARQGLAATAGGPAGAGAAAAEVTLAEGAAQAAPDGGVEAASAGEGAPAAEGAGAPAGAGAGEAAAGEAGAGPAGPGPAGPASAGMASGEATAAGGVASVDTGAGELATGDLVLIDIELAEHERWAGALGRVGEVASVERAGFIAEQVGSGFIGGAASGAAMGLGIGLVTRVVPAIGPAIGGAMALHGLVTRDWAATGATIGHFGEGNDTYEVLANTLASVSAVIDVVSGVLSVINGIVGVVQLAAIGIAAGATVLAFFTFGATAGVAIAAGELAVVCEEITVAINLVTGALDRVNAAVLSPCITLFRALHSFTADADPREVEANGADISSAAAASGAALGAWAGGRAAAARPRGGRQEAPTPTRRPPHETPPAAAGDGPLVRYTPVAGAEAADAPAGAASAAPHPVSAALPEGPSAAAASVLPVPVAAGHADAATAAAAGGTGGAGGGGGGGGGGGSSGGTGGGGGHGGGPTVDPVLTGRRPEAGGMVIHEFGRPGIDTLQHLDVDATVAALDPHASDGPRATTDTFFELPAGRDVPAAPGSATTAPTLPPHGLQDVEIRMNPDPTLIQYHENMRFEGVTQARVAEHGDIAMTERGATTGAPGRPHTAGSVLPDDPSRVTTSAVPVRAPPSPRAGEPFPVEVRLHSANPSPGLAASAPHAHSRFNPTAQVNTRNGQYLLPDGRWVPQNSPDIGPAHYPVGGRDRGPAGLGEVPGIPGGVPTPPGSGGPPSRGGPGSGGAGPAPGGAGPAGPAGSAPAAATPAGAASASTAAVVSGAAASSTGPLPAPAGASWTVAAREARRVVADASANAAGVAAPAATAAGGAAAVAGTAPASAPSVGWGERAHQAGALFLPQFFGPSGPAPTFAERRAAHRARFAADKQPAEGVERVNPHYNVPPATPAQILEIQNQILNLLSVRALAEQEAEQQAGRAEACEQNAGPIAATVADTAASQSALAEHRAAVARREAANQAQQQRQTEAGDLVAGYPSRATGLAALELPLTAWRGFTSLASHLPGSAGHRMAEMNREADTMQHALTAMGSQMLGSDAAQPAQAAALVGDAGVLSATVGQAQASGGDLQTSAQGAAALQSANAAAQAEARRREGAAEQREGQLAAAAAEREQRADTLAEQLQQWAQQHGAQRQQAIAATTERLQAEGHAVTGSTAR